MKSTKPIQNKPMCLQHVQYCHSVNETVAHSLLARFEEVLSFLGLAAENPAVNQEWIHQLRIAIRKAVAALKFYRELLPKKSMKRLKKQLQHLRIATNEVRDYDVTADLLPKEWACQFQRLQQERLVIQAPLLVLFQCLERKDYLKKQMSQLLEEIQHSKKKHNTTTFSKWKKRRLQKKLENLWKIAPTRKASLAALHRFRIRVKELRYMIELFGEAIPFEIQKKIYPKLKTFQKKLGRIHDFVMLQRNIQQQLTAASAADSILLRKMFIENKRALANACTAFFATL